MKIFIYAIIFTFFISVVNATTLKIAQDALIENGWGCVYLVSISKNDKGYINWKFDRKNYSSCQNAKLDFIKSDPKKALRGADNVNQDNTFKSSFNIITTPEIRSLSIMTINMYSITGWLKFTAKGKVPQLLEISSLGDWKKNFTNSETLLVEKKSKDKTLTTLDMFWGEPLNKPVVCF